MSQAASSAMAAVIGRRPDDIMRIVEKERLKAIEPANYNTPTNSS